MVISENVAFGEWTTIPVNYGIPSSSDCYDIVPLGIRLKYKHN
jgi:hypothetical protein